MTEDDENQIQSAMNTVSTLNAAFSAFDELIQSPYAYKVETVGKVYMAVSGAPGEMIRKSYFTKY